MRQVLYAKYNRTRQRKFQTKVEIELVDGVKHVIKAPLCEEAVAHIDKISRVHEIYRDYYNNISLLEYRKTAVGVECDFVKGVSLAEIIQRDSADAKLFIANTRKWLDEIVNVNEKYIADFRLTEGFTDLFNKPFGIEEYHGKAFLVCNLDSIFDNFYCTEDSGIIAIDPEWFVDVLTPIDFIRYRAIKMLYDNNMELLSKEYSLKGFCVECGIDERFFSMFRFMDNGFQQYAHGVLFEAIYTERYKKKRISFADWDRDKELLGLKDNHINNLEELNGNLRQKQAVFDAMDQQLRVYKRALHNPFYALYRLFRKVGKKLLPQSVKTGLKVWKNEGYAAFRYRAKERKRRDCYEEWITDIERARHNELLNKQYGYRPLISVLVPVYNVKANLLKECVDSVINQTYDNWQLCLVDDCSTLDETKSMLKQYEGRANIDIEYRTENGHISACTNQALTMAKGDFVALLDCDDTLSKDALLEVVNSINENPDVQFLYSDEDKIDEGGNKRFDPYFKPDWSPDTIMCSMYTCHLGVFKRDLVESLGGLRIGYEGSQDYDLVLRVMEKLDWKNIVHIPQILYHWRTRAESTALNVSTKPYILEATKKAKEDALRRRNIEGEVEYIDDVFQFRIKYAPKMDSFVSIIIPSKDNPEILRQCLQSIRGKTTYPKYEIIIVDNGSSEENRQAYEHLCDMFSCRYFYKPMEFNFSHMCNLGAEYAVGNYLLFLNDDIEVINGEWMERMLGQAQLPHVGAVGAKLLYPNSDFIQHAGVINIAPGPSHALLKQDDKKVLYFGLNKIDTDFLAVTAACLMISKAKYSQVGGFDENLRVAYNDVDFCFKLIEAGYYNVTRTDAVLYHYESFSRGIDTVDDEKSKRLIAEREKLYSKHPRFALSKGMDPFYSSNLVQNNIDYSNNYHNLNRNLYLPFIQTNISRYKETNKISAGVEVCIITKTSLYVSGWMYRNDKNSSNGIKQRLLLFKEDGTCLTFEPNRQYRPDIANRTSCRGNSMTGFVFSSSLKEDLTGCRIAVALGKQYCHIK